jgi:hypothetical protein
LERWGDFAKGTKKVAQWPTEVIPPFSHAADFIEAVSFFLASELPPE